MDKSGSRHTALTSPLIERADLQSFRQRMLYGALSLVFWVFWFYLWVPVLALLAWTLGVQQAYKYMVELQGYRDLSRLFVVYGAVILVLCGGLVMWATYNILRFRGVERRTSGAELTPTIIGKAFAIAPQSIERWQGEQRLSVIHDAGGQIARVDALGIHGALAEGTTSLPSKNSPARVRVTSVEGVSR